MKAKKIKVGILQIITVDHAPRSFPASSQPARNKGNDSTERIKGILVRLCEDR